jgi:hypothetical protein
LMRQDDQYDQTAHPNDHARAMSDPARDAHATGLAGIPTTDMAEDTSESGVAGSSTFDPHVSPAHEGLAGSPAERDEKDKPS